MKIKNVEERTGLSRSNVRFYEKEKLIEPSRNESNGYRDYSENDVENIPSQQRRKPMKALPTIRQSPPPAER